MTSIDRQQIAEEELQNQSEEAGICFNRFAERLKQLCNCSRSPDSWNDAADMWLVFIDVMLDTESEDELIARVAELIEEMKEE